MYLVLIESDFVQLSYIRSVGMQKPSTTLFECDCDDRAALSAAI